MGKYDEIMHMSRPVSKVHPPMDRAARAKQFMPFAALTGYGDAIDETARLTDEKLDLTEDQLRLLDEKLNELRALLSRKPGNVQQPEVTFVWFEPDERKDGGAYVTRTGIVKKIDDTRRTVLLEDGILIPMDALSEIEF